jgi:hypothetical protein
MIARLRRLIASLLIVSIAGLGLPLPAHAGTVSTDAALASAERARITDILGLTKVFPFTRPIK